MEIIKKKENGNLIIDSKAIEDMAEIALSKVENAIPVKEGKSASCKVKNDEMIVEITVKLYKGIDVDKTCREIQKNVYEHIYEMSSIKIKHVDIIVQGFEVKK